MADDLSELPPLEHAKRIQKGLLHATEFIESRAHWSNRALIRRVSELNHQVIDELDSLIAKLGAD